MTSQEAGDRIALAIYRTKERQAVRVPDAIWQKVTPEDRMALRELAIDRGVNLKTHNI